MTQLEHGEWLTAQRREGEAQALLAEASETFERLRATPWVEWAARAVGERVPQSAGRPNGQNR